MSVRQRLPSLRDAKYLGGIGSVLLLLTLIPDFGVVFLIAGLILVGVAIKKISDETGERPILNNFLLAILISVLGGAAAVVAAVALGVVSLLNFFAFLAEEVLENFSPTSQEVLNWALQFLTIILVSIAIVWVSAIVSSIFLRRSYNLITKRLNVDLFKTAGLLYLVGAALIIILIGFIIILVALILQVIAFFTIPEELPEQKAGAGGQLL